MNLSTELTVYDPVTRASRHPRLGLFAPNFSHIYTGPRALHGPLAHFFAFCQERHQVEAEMKLFVEDFGFATLKYFAADGYAAGGAYAYRDPAVKNIGRILRGMVRAQVLAARQPGLQIEKARCQ